jgi:hypothetical protein
MELIVHKVYEYIAIDGEKFSSKVDCEQYEGNLPRHLRYCLEKKISAQDLLSDEESNYEIGYDCRQSHTGYESAGFLREGGEYRYITTSETILSRFHGTLSHVIYFAVQDPWFWRHCFKDAFIRKVEFKHVTTEEHIEKNVEE